MSKLNSNDFYYSGPGDLFRYGLIINELKKNKINGLILDAGSGNGGLGMILSSYGYRVVCMDNSEQATKYLKKQIIYQNRYNIQAKRGSVIRIPFNKNHFDAVVCSEVIEHIRNDKKALSEFNRVLKPAGLLIITTPAKPEKWDIVDDISKHFRRYIAKDLINKVNKSGFYAQRLFYWGFPLYFIWHIFIVTPYLIKSKKIYSHIDLTLIKKVPMLKKLNIWISKLFYLDILFNRTKLGNWIFLTARKSK